MINFEKHESKEKNVWKYIFHLENGIAEAVLYKYNDFMERAVICVSTQCGCPVGCKFCGSGGSFKRNLTRSEILNQVHLILDDNKLNSEIINSKKFQIMFMSMGEPFLNYKEVSLSIRDLNQIYPNAQLLVSTVGVNDGRKFVEFIELAKKIDKIGLQFSIHASNDINRNLIIPYKNKMNLEQIANTGILFHSRTGRQVFLNYIVNPMCKDYDLELWQLQNIFNPEVFCFTFSVKCEIENGEITEENMDVLNYYSNGMLSKGYNTRIFNPAGKDDIGGGCGQLHSVQRYFESENTKVFLRDDGRSISELEYKGHKHRGCGFILLSVRGDETTVLICKRSKKESKGSGKWCFPGGSIERGESALHGMIREIKEELGIYVDGNTISLIAHTNLHHREEFLFLSEIGETSGPKPGICDEIDEYAFVSFDELSEFDLWEPSLRSLMHFQKFNNKWHDYHIALNSKVDKIIKGS